MKKLLMMAALPLLVGLGGCSEEKKCISGKGERVSREYVVPPFKHLDVSGSEEVIVTKGEDFSLVIEAQENIHERLEIEVSGEELSVEIENCVWNHKNLKIYITMPELRNISVSGSGEVKVQDVFTSDKAHLHVSGSGEIDHLLITDELELGISGSGEISLSGSTGHQNVQISGSGDYYGRGMQSKTCDIRISGSGNAEVYVTDFMDVKISGSGNVYYLGDPTMNVEVSGSGKIQKL